MANRREKCGLCGKEMLESEGYRRKEDNFFVCENCFKTTIINQTIDEQVKRFMQAHNCGSCRNQMRIHAQIPVELMSLGCCLYVNECGGLDSLILEMEKEVGPVKGVAMFNLIRGYFEHLTRKK